MCEKENKGYMVFHLLGVSTSTLYNLKCSMKGCSLDFGRINQGWEKNKIKGEKLGWMLRLRWLVIERESLNGVGLITGRPGLVRVWGVGLFEMLMFSPSVCTMKTTEECKVDVQTDCLSVCHVVFTLIIGDRQCPYNIFIRDQDLHLCIIFFF